MSDITYANCRENQAEFVSYYLIGTTGSTEGLKEFIGHDWQ